MHGCGQLCMATSGIWAGKADTAAGMQRGLAGGGQLPAENRPPAAAGESACAGILFSSMHGWIVGTVGTMLCRPLGGLAMVWGMVVVVAAGVAAGWTFAAGAACLRRSAPRWWSVLLAALWADVVVTVLAALIGPPWLLVEMALSVVWVLGVCARDQSRWERDGRMREDTRREHFVLVLSPEIGRALAGCPLCALEGVEGHDAGL